MKKVLLLVCCAAMFYTTGAFGRMDDKAELPEQSAATLLQDEPEKLLMGSWVFESVSMAFDRDAPTAISVDDIDFETPVEIDIQPNEVVFLYKNRTDTMEYNRVVVEKRWFYLPTRTLTSWKRVEDKLLLEQGRDVDFPTGETKIRTIALTYKPK